LDPFYEDAASLFVRAYDAFYDREPPQIAGDVDFYQRLAGETSGPALELGCGTGRIALALAARGLDVTGADLSDGMLTIARRKAAGLPAAVQDRLTLVKQDMSEVNLGRRFGFIFVAFRPFQHLLTIDLQRKSLEAIRRHLDHNGRLALHLFDPRLDLLINENIASARLFGIDPVTQHRPISLLWCLAVRRATPVSLIERNPLLFRKCLIAILAAIILLLLFLRSH
jgi:SAM-dependent methyltransferase